MRAPHAVGALSVAVLLLTGCAAGGGSDVPSSDPAPTEDAGTGTGSDTGLGGATEVPENFPRDDVPLLDGEVVYVQDLGTGWVVAFASDDPVADYAVARDLLVGAGFETVLDQAQGDQAGGQFRTAGYTVNLSAADDPTLGPAVSYTVVIAG
jgi:ABC-type phosphate transport system substrate-binding protein